MAKVCAVCRNSVDSVTSCGACLEGKSQNWTDAQWAEYNAAEDDYYGDDGCEEAENAWLRAAEYDQEAQDEMYRQEDAMYAF